jgi:hypothetical protein
MMRNLLSTVVFSSSLVFTACAATPGNDPSNSTGTVSADEDAASAVDAADSASAEGDLMMAAVDGSDAGGLLAAAVSAKISANVSARFTPSGCATITPGADALAIKFNDCTGPRGLVHITGELDLTASIAKGAITVKGASTDLKLNGADLDVDATATYAVTASGPTLTVTTATTGTGPRGNAVDHNGDYTIAWDPATACRSLDGTWSTDRAAGSTSNTVELSQCGGGCPTGSIARTFVDGKTLTISFDGTATASWSLAAAGAAAGSAGSASGSAAASGTITLDCK